jgi:hypothetical protein
MLTTPKQITRALDRVLHKVEKPARYTGGELNSIVKPIGPTRPSAPRWRWPSPTSTNWAAATSA